MHTQFTPANIVCTQLANFRSLKPGKNILEYNTKFNHLLNNLPQGIPKYVAQDYYLGALSDQLQLMIQTDPDNLRSF